MRIELIVRNAGNQPNYDTSSDEEMEIESALDSDEISDVEDEYE